YLEAENTKNTKKRRTQRTQRGHPPRLKERHLEAITAKNAEAAFWRVAMCKRKDRGGGVLVNSKRNREGPAKQIFCRNFPCPPRILFSFKPGRTYPPRPPRLVGNLQ